MVGKDPGNRTATPVPGSVNSAVGVPFSEMFLLEVQHSPREEQAWSSLFNLAKRPNDEPVPTHRSCVVQCLTRKATTKNVNPLSNCFPQDIEGMPACQEEFKALDYTGRAGTEEDDGSCSSHSGC